MKTVFVCQPCGVLLAAMQLQAPLHERRKAAKDVLSLTWTVEDDKNGFQAVGSSHKVEKHKWGHYYWTTLPAARLGSDVRRVAGDDPTAEAAVWKAVEKMMTKLKWPPAKITALIPKREPVLRQNVQLFPLLRSWLAFLLSLLLWSVDVRLVVANAQQPSRIWDSARRDTINSLELLDELEGAAVEEDYTDDAAFKWIDLRRDVYKRRKYDIEIKVSTSVCDFASRC